MSIEKRLKAAGKDLQGKAQEAIGEITGNPQDKLEGQARQVEAEVRRAEADIDLETIQNRVEATAKNLEGKVQQAIGDLTGNIEDKVAGRAKQADAASKHMEENLKE